MYKVGDFSKISRVSVKALRYYDERGLLKPVHVDQVNGYRYYSIDQLPRLNRILALKDLGLSLEQIGGILDEQVTSTEIRGMLRLKQAEMQQVVYETQERLARVEERLKQIEQEDRLPVYDIVIKDVTSQPIASARAVVAATETVKECCRVLAHDIWTTISHAGIKMVGPWCAIYHDAVEERNPERAINVEMAVVIDLSPASTCDSWQHERVVIRELLGSASMACLVHTDDYQGLWDAYAAILLWISTNGYQIVGPCRVFYLRMAPEQSHPVSEIQIPVEKVPDFHE